MAGLTAMLAAHVGLAFEIVFAGHAGSMPAHGIGSLALFSPVNEFIETSPVAVHDDRRASPHAFDGRDLAVMRKRLVAWTILTCALLAVAVWTVLGPPDRPAGPHLPSRNLTAAVR
ncbi:hypothetical protein [Bradyrhizobium iriomotense]|uniref:hypothetical protein n=1 Tax=Bradyrhizobium iriomotense TaxID=441950 RepID=UPI001B89ED57|nr:hypothetical protein [Bradyrhizobium iriomotense]MBR1133922.1 hypothetical protein [Bradyrhizobium iriomotense]